MGTEMACVTAQASTFGGLAENAAALERSVGAKLGSVSAFGRFWPTTARHLGAPQRLEDSGRTARRPGGFGWERRDARKIDLERHYVQKVELERHDIRKVMGTARRPARRPEGWSERGRDASALVWMLGGFCCMRSVCTHVSCASTSVSTHVYKEGFLLRVCFFSFLSHATSCIPLGYILYNLSILQIKYPSSISVPSLFLPLAVFARRSFALLCSPYFFLRLSSSAFARRAFARLRPPTRLSLVFAHSAFTRSSVSPYASILGVRSFSVHPVLRPPTPQFSAFTRSAIARLYPWCSLVQRSPASVFGVRSFSDRPLASQ